MIRDRESWKTFEISFSKSSQDDLETKFRILEVLIEHARRLGVWPPKELLVGLETDLCLARVLNANAHTSSR